MEPLFCRNNNVKQKKEKMTFSHKMYFPCPLSWCIIKALSKCRKPFKRDTWTFDPKKGWKKLHSYLSCISEKKYKLKKEAELINIHYPLCFEHCGREESSWNKFAVVSMLVESKRYQSVGKERERERGRAVVRDWTLRRECTQRVASHREHRQLVALALPRKG